MGITIQSKRVPETGDKLGSVGEGSGMKGKHALTISIVLAVAVAALPTPAHGLETVTVKPEHTFKVTYWWASVTASPPGGGSASWSTGIWIIDYRLSSLRGPWGFQVQFGTGSQGSWGGAFSSATSGTDTIWNVDVNYRSVIEPFTVFWFAGYGSIKWETTLPAGVQRITSSGPRVGFDALLPLWVRKDGSNLSINGAVAWYPSNTISSFSGGTTTTSTGSATDYSISIRYKFPSAARPGGRGTDYYPTSTLSDGIGTDGTSWSAAFGVKGTTGSSWSGIFFAVGKTFQ